MAGADGDDISTDLEGEGEEENSSGAVSGAAAGEENPVDDDSNQSTEIESGGEEEGNDDGENAIPFMASRLRGLGRRATRGGRGGSRSSKKKAKQIALKKQELKDKDLADTRYLIEGIGEIMEGALKCADVSLAGFEKTEKSEVNKVKSSTVKKFYDLSIALTEAKEKIKVCAEVVDNVYEDLDIEGVSATEANDEQFFKLIEEFEEAATKKVEERWKEIGMKEVKKDAMYQKFLVCINKCIDRGTEEPKPNIEEEPQPGPSSSANSRGGGSRRSDRNETTAESQGLEELSEYLPTQDPITRKHIQNPCKHSKCGHIYDYDSIFSLLITSKKNVKCPYPICKSIVTVDDLCKDAALAKRIAEKIAEETRRKPRKYL